MNTKSEPIERIQWLPVELLHANDWNPNVVLNQELRLLEFSILESGWIQPVLVSKDFMVIDGFHRWALSRDSKALKSKYEGKVPCVVMDLEPWEAMLLTVRINRAKGSHMAVRMAELIKVVVDEYGVSLEEVGKQIGANKKEVHLLYQDSIFKRKNLKDYKYSKAWVPKEVP